MIINKKIFSLFLNLLKKYFFYDFFIIFAKNLIMKLINYIKALVESKFVTWQAYNEMLNGTASKQKMKRYINKLNEMLKPIGFEVSIKKLK